MISIPAFHTVARLTENHRDYDGAMIALKSMFPTGCADMNNFVMFSTSGVHGSYTTIEEIEESLLKYGDDLEDHPEEPDDFTAPKITVLVIRPRVVSLCYGVARVRLADIDWLKKLRASSISAFNDSQS